MRSVLVVLVAAAVPITVSETAAAQDAPVAIAGLAVPDISGDWTRSDGNARVHIASCGGRICATNTWAREDEDGWVVGDQIVITLTPVGQSQSAFAGFAYDAKRDRKYSVRVSLENGTLKTQGCLMAGIICKSTVWTRAR